MADNPTAPQEERGRLWRGLSPRRLHDAGITVSRHDFWVRDSVTNECRVMTNAEWTADMATPAAPAQDVANGERVGPAEYHKHVPGCKARVGRNTIVEARCTCDWKTRLAVSPLQPSPETLQEPKR